MCKNLSKIDLQIILNDSSFKTVATVIAKNIVDKEIKNPFDFVKTISQEPAFEKQHQLCVKILQCIGGHFIRKEIPLEIKKTALKMEIGLRYNATNANEFARILKYAEIANSEPFTIREVGVSS